jgi:hypothetical protein
LCRCCWRTTCCWLQPWSPRTQGACLTCCSEYLLQFIVPAQSVVPPCLLIMQLAWLCWVSNGLEMMCFQALCLPQVL